jgi:ubiquinone biosynthesis accessory factor UbiK
MDKFTFLEDLQTKLSELLEHTPAGDLQRNLKALLQQQFAKLDLVTREDFEVQAELAARTRGELEARMARLEARLGALEAGSGK